MMTHVIPPPDIPPIPANTAAILREVARQTKLGSLTWEMLPGMAWEVETDDIFPRARYPASPVYTFFENGHVELRLHVGARGAPAITIEIRSSDGFLLDRVQIDSIYDREGFFELLQETHRSAVVEAQVRETVDHTETLVDILDELTEDNSGEEL